MSETEFTDKPICPKCKQEGEAPGSWASAGLTHCASCQAVFEWERFDTYCTKAVQ